MTRLVLALLLIGCADSVLADEKPKSSLSDARKRLLKGNTAEAREQYEQLAKEEKTRVAATIGLVRSWQAEGEYRKCLLILGEAMKRAEDAANPDLLAVRADLLYQTGKWDEANADVAAALKAKKDHFLARWVRAQILRDTGDIAAADTEMRWFVRTYTQLSNADMDIKDPDMLLIVGQAGSENARWHNLTDQFRFILNEVYADVLKFEPDQWQAEYLAGMMLLEKYNRPDALAAFDKALKLNPRAAEAYVGKGEAAMQRLEYKDAEGFVDEALKINPRLPMALNLKSDIYLAAGETEKALKSAQEAYAVNAREEATLARLAACRLLLKQDKAFEEVVAEATKSNPKPAVFYTELAACLEDRKRFNEAETYFKKAIQLRDKLPGPRTGLGMLYLRMGREAEAKELLVMAFENDKFNVRVANSLKVLRHLDKYETLKTKNYDIRYDAATDKALAGFIGDYLEEIHGRLEKDFAHAPKERVIFELFNSHEMFSGRTVALPDLHTIGACTGRVVTMVSPRGKGVNKPFNWGRVIRHELVHIFNLDQTEFRVPHWLTEGLAVRNEGGNRPPSWSVLLKERFEKDQLLSLDTIQLGFVRPRSPDEWTLAYCQSHLYVEYILKNHGIPAIAELLNAYRDGLDDKGVIQKVCKQDVAEFEKGYKAYLGTVVKSIPSQRASEKMQTLDEMEKALEAKPDDVDLKARIADQYQRRKRAGEARKLADAVLAKVPGQPLASIVKAKLLAAAGDDEAARSLLDAAVKANPEDTRLIAYYGRMCVDAKDFAKAASLFEHGRKVAPLDADWLEMLDEIYVGLKDNDKRLPILREMVANDPDDLKARLTLAKLLLDAGKPADAEVYAREALQIDVLDETARKTLLQALTEQNKTGEAEKVKARFEN